MWWLGSIESIQKDAFLQEVPREMRSRAKDGTSPPVERAIGRKLVCHPLFQASFSDQVPRKEKDYAQ